MENCFSVLNIKISLKKVFFSLSCIFILNCGIWGTDYTWTGARGATGSWDDVSKWTPTPPAGGPGAGDSARIEYASTITIPAGGVTVDLVTIPNPNQETDSFTVTLTGGDLNASKIETVRAAAPGAGTSATSTLIFDCNVTSPNLVLHSGANITFNAGTTANITTINTESATNSFTLDTILQIDGTLKTSSGFTFKDYESGTRYPSVSKTSQGTLETTGKITVSSEYIADYLTLKCETLAATENLHCNTVEVSGASTISKDLWTRTGGGVPVFTGAVTVNGSTDQLLFIPDGPYTISPVISKTGGYLIFHVGEVTISGSNLDSTASDYGDLKFNCKVTFSGNPVIQHASKVIFDAGCSEVSGSGTKSFNTDVQNVSASLTLNSDIIVSGNFTDNGTITGTGKITLNGNSGSAKGRSEQTFTPSATSTYTEIVINKINDANHKVTFDAATKLSATKITLTSNGVTEFAGEADIAELADYSSSGNISFLGGGAITKTGGQTFNTTGTVTIGGSSTHTFTFGTVGAASYESVTRTAGITKIAGTINAADFTNDTGATLTVTDDAELSGNLINKSSVEITAGKTLSVKGNVDDSAGTGWTGASGAATAGTLCFTGSTDQLFTPSTTVAAAPAFNYPAVEAKLTGAKLTVGAETSIKNFQITSGNIDFNDNIRFDTVQTTASSASSITFKGTVTIASDSEITPSGTNKISVEKNIDATNKLTLSSPVIEAGSLAESAGSVLKAKELEITGETLIKSSDAKFEADNIKTAAISSSSASNKLTLKSDTPGGSIQTGHIGSVTTGFDLVTIDGGSSNLHYKGTITGSEIYANTVSLKTTGTLKIESIKVSSILNLDAGTGKEVSLIGGTAPSILGAETITFATIPSKLLLSGKIEIAGSAGFEVPLSATSIGIPVTLEKDTIIATTYAAAPVTLWDNIDGNKKLTIDNKGNFTLKDVTGASDASATRAKVAGFVQTGTGDNYISGDILSSGTIDIASKTTLNGNVYFEGTNLVFQNTIDDSAANSDNLELKSTAAGNAGSIIISDSIGGTAKIKELTVTNSGLLQTADGKNIQAESFVQNGTGQVMLGGSLILDNNSSIAENLYLYGSTGTQTISDATGKITIAKNLIVSTASARQVFLEKIEADNFALYSGITTISKNVTANKDIVLFGANYSADDSVSGMTGAFRYEQERFAGAAPAVSPASPAGAINNYTLETNFPDENTLAVPPVSATPLITNGGSLSIATGVTLAGSKNFYANGLALSGNGSLSLPSNSDSTSSFAEAYNCNFTANGISVICSTPTPAGGAAFATLVACENCASYAPAHFANGWNQEELKIEEAYTVRDNVIYIKFSRPLRNKNGELNYAILNQFVMGDDSPGPAASAVLFSGPYSDAECTTPIAAGTEPDEIYLKANQSWNTDATGINAGTSESTDRNGDHKTVKPLIDLMKNGTAGASGTSVSLSWTFTDAYGKRISNFSKRTPTAGTSYTATLDYTGPVLISVKTGQETHNTSAASQESFDAHNFLEFRYSEPVNFGDTTKSATPSAAGAKAEWLPANAVSGTTVQNIYVSTDCGIVTSPLSDNVNLTFAGLGQTVANGQLRTGKQGADDPEVNALYRLDKYSIRLSVAGYTDPAAPVSGHKNWTGYIEEAVLPSGSVTLNASALSPNLFVTDCAMVPAPLPAAGTVEKYNPQIMNKPGLTVETPSPSAGVYGDWDLFSPTFVKVRIKAQGEQSFYESIGATAGTTITQIEVHITDNPSGAPSLTKSGYWFTGFGWASDPLTPDASTLLDYSADNLIGGSRPYDASSKTTGGIRFCTLASQSGAFTVNKINNSPAPASQYVTAVLPGATAPFFTGSGSTRYVIPSADDNTYIKLMLSDTTLSPETTFTFSYDDSNSFITDLAGNRLRSSPNMETLDRTPPDFKATLGPIGSDQIMISFVKQLSDTIKFDADDGRGTQNIPESFGEIVPYCFSLGKISGTFTPNSAGTDLQIDTTQPAQIVSSLSNTNFTTILLKLNRPIELADVKDLYIQLKNAGTVNGHNYGPTSPDPFTGLAGRHVTFIQDILGNYMTMYDAHALSDFATGLVNLKYAYNEGMEVDATNLGYGLYEKNSWAVHDWNRNQNNYGTLTKGHPVTIISEVSDQISESTESIKMYFTASPDSGSQSAMYNNDLGASLRIWFPDPTPLSPSAALFPAYALVNNTNYNSIQSSFIDDDPLSPNYQKFAGGLKFQIDQATAQNWPDNSQITLLFELCDGSGAAQKRCFSPQLIMAGGNPSYNTSQKQPILIFRMQNSSDITSLDLWSFRIKNIQSQRGGVTITNNVIDIRNGSKAVIKLNNPKEGNVNVIIMTLDGNVITYLNHGSTAAGEHFFTWDGRNNAGNPVARGLYFVRVIGNDFDETRKVMVVK